jgi:hypothetical protein
MSLDVFNPAPKAFPDFNELPADPAIGGAVEGPMVGGSAVLPHDAPPSVHDPDIAAELALLRQIRDAGLAGAAHLAISGKAPPSITEVDYPVPGVKRWLLPRVPTGGEVAIAEAPWTTVLRTNHSRIGGSVVNSGTKAVVLALASENSITAISGRLYLAPEGGAWDLRLSDVTWAGAAIAFAIGGASALQVIEL